MTGDFNIAVAGWCYAFAVVDVTEGRLLVAGVTALLGVANWMVATWARERRAAR